MDYAQLLREERTKAHAVFHTIIMGLLNANESTKFLFFEGEDDPSFYCPHIRSRHKTSNLISNICNGRAEVIKTFHLIYEDGRAYSRSLFFIDKDHNDITGIVVTDLRLFQTEYYSIENYLVNETVIDTYWTEILHLDSLDVRKSHYFSLFKNLYNSFISHAPLLMALILIGRGINGNDGRKLNLNNANLDLIFHLDFDNEICKYLLGAGKHFCLSTNIIDYSHKDLIKYSSIRNIIKNNFKGKDVKIFLRGKYELWFLIKFLNYMTHKLTDKNLAKITGLKRATCKIQISKDTAIEHLGPRLLCPQDLQTFLDQPSQ